MRAQFEQNQVKSDVASPGENQPSAEKVQKVNQTQAINELEIEDEKEVKTEIRKILITILVLILIVIAIYIINIKSDIILKVGQFIAEKLNLSI